MPFSFTVGHLMLVSFTQALAKIWDYSFSCIGVSILTISSVARNYSVRMVFIVWFFPFYNPSFLFYASLGVVNIYSCICMSSFVFVIPILWVVVLWPPLLHLFIVLLGCVRLIHLLHQRWYQLGFRVKAHTWPTLVVLSLFWYNVTMRSIDLCFPQIWVLWLQWLLVLFSTWTLVIVNAS